MELIVQIIVLDLFLELRISVVHSTCIYMYVRLCKNMHSKGINTGPLDKHCLSPSRLESCRKGSEHHPQCHPSLLPDAVDISTKCQFGKAHWWTKKLVMLIMEISFGCWKSSWRQIAHYPQGYLSWTTRSSPTIESFLNVMLCKLSTELYPPFLEVR